MPKTRPLTCVNCTFWCQYSNGGSGECRRHAPAPMYSMTGDKPGPIWWPQTLASFWCGDFEIRNGAMRSEFSVSIDNYVIAWNKALASAKATEKYPENFPKKIHKKNPKGKQDKNIMETE